MIGVKSKDEEIVGRYDGKDYTFKPGVVVAISQEAATHIFGYGLDDKSRALIRLGWVANSTGLKDALDRLSKVQFLSESKTVFEEPSADKGIEMASSGKGKEITIPEFAKK